MKGKNLLCLKELSKEEIEKILDLARLFKIKNLTGEEHRLLPGKTLGMIFAKPSTRTRISFEVGLNQLGGTAFYYGVKDLQLGRSESIADTARTLSRYLDCLLIRTFSHQEAIELAKYATIPVINGLTDLFHPCQILADLFTIYEKKNTFKGLKIAYLGDGGNNIAHSLLQACSKMGIDLFIASPAGFMPNSEILHNARKIAADHSLIKITENPEEAVKNADIIYTDIWTGMGQETEETIRSTVFKKYQVNRHLVKKAKENFIFLHCLPARRGEEVTDEIADSEHSVIFTQAENRLHVQKALLRLLL